MKNRLFIVLLFIISSSFNDFDSNCDVKNKSILMLQSNSYAFTSCLEKVRYSIENTKNIPKQIIITVNDSAKENKKSKKGKTISFCIINNKDSTISISTQDGLMPFIQEAQDSNGVWKPIEFWLNSRCGNSYFKTELNSKEAISVPIRKYQGDFQTHLRIKVKINDEIFYSNPFQGAIYPSQFKYFYIEKNRSISRKKWKSIKNEKKYESHKRKDVKRGISRPAHPDFLN